MGIIRRLEYKWSYTLKINATLTDGLQYVFSRVHDGDPRLGPHFFENMKERPRITVIILLIQKCERPTKATDYWPIILLNCYYKITVGVVAACLKKDSYGCDRRCPAWRERISKLLTVYHDFFTFIGERDVEMEIAPMDTFVGSCGEMGGGVWKFPGPPAMGCRLLL